MDRVSKNKTTVSRAYVFRSINAALQKRKKGFFQLGLNEKGIEKLAKLYTDKVMEGFQKDLIFKP